MAKVFYPELVDPLVYIDRVDIRDDPDDEYWDEFVSLNWPDTYNSTQWKRKDDWDE